MGGLSQKESKGGGGGKQQCFHNSVTNGAKTSSRLRIEVSSLSFASEDPR